MPSVFGMVIAWFGSCLLLIRLSSSRACVVHLCHWISQCPFGVCLRLIARYLIDVWHFSLLFRRWHIHSSPSSSPSSLYWPNSSSHQPTNPQSQPQPSFPYLSPKSNFVAHLLPAVFENNCTSTHSWVLIQPYRISKTDFLSNNTSPTSLPLFKHRDMLAAMRLCGCVVVQLMLCV